MPPLPSVKTCPPVMSSAPKSSAIGSSTTGSSGHQLLGGRPRNQKMEHSCAFSFASSMIRSVLSNSAETGRQGLRIHGGTSSHREIHIARRHSALPQQDCVRKLLDHRKFVLWRVCKASRPWCVPVWSAVCGVCAELSYQLRLRPPYRSCAVLLVSRLCETLSVASHEGMGLGSAPV